MSPSAGRMPIMILTGFLGSGKTSLLLEHLRKAETARNAVIVNEFGREQVDGDLVTHAGDATVLETTTGCVCCSISGDVREALVDLARRVSSGEIAPIEQVIIETTGLADPSRLCHAVASDTRLKAPYRIAGVVTVLDALRGEYGFDRYEEARRQVALADTIVFSKTDLIEDPVSRRELEALDARLRQFNPLAETVRRDISGASRSLCARRYDYRRRRDLEPSAHEPLNGHSAASFSVNFHAPVSLETLRSGLSNLGERFGRNLLRVKGLVDVADGPEGAALIQGVCGQFEFQRTGVAPNGSRLVFITENLSPGDVIAALDRAGLHMSEVAHGDV
jgi:G3E family GTPase